MSWPSRLSTLLEEVSSACSRSRCAARHRRFDQQRVGTRLGCSPKALGLAVVHRRVAKILRAAPAEQNDRDVQEECDREGAVVGGDGRGTEGRRQDLATERHEKDDGSCGGAAGDQMAARDPYSPSPRRLHVPVSFPWPTVGK